MFIKGALECQSKDHVLKPNQMSSLTTFDLTIKWIGLYNIVCMCVTNFDNFPLILATLFTVQFTLCA